MSSLPTLVHRHPATSNPRFIAAASLLALVAACSGDSTSPLSPTDEAASGAKKAQATTVTMSTTTYSNLAGMSFWVDPYSSAKKTADSWRTTRPADALQMDKIAGQPQARWFGNWNSDIYAAVYAATTQITAAGKVPVFVAYNIPQRDCGGFSGGNTTIASQYRSWIGAFASAIGSRKAIVILEPDALAAMDCLSPTDQTTRLDLLNYAVQSLASKGSIRVYIDAGNPRWRSASTMAARLAKAGIWSAAGFALNVSNFFTTAENVTYGQQIAAQVGNKHFIIDTGRNGLGPTADAQWCNPAGRALGSRPTTSTSYPLVDALLWIKTPGESDGSCNGAPAAGTWMPEYALGLAQRAAY
jgi:endoglucanase